MALDFYSAMQWILQNRLWIALGFAITIIILVIIWWKRRGKDYGPTTVLMEFDATGISEPNYVAREDQGPSFVSFYRADGNVEYKKKSRIAISIPDKKGKSYDIIYWNPRGSNGCVEIDEQFPGFKPRDQLVEEKVSEHENQFQVMRKNALPSDLLGGKGKIILICVAVLGFALGVVLDAGMLHIGAH